MSIRPNILLITADQLRWDCVGCYGNHAIQTPHIDRLAKNGIAFDQAYVPATLCVPSRQSILTGQYPSSHGALSNRSALPEGTPTFVSLLRDSGYLTAAFGKMHFHPTYANYGFQKLHLAEQDGEGRQHDDYHHRYLNALGLEDTWDEWDQVYTRRQNAPEEYWETYGARHSELPLEHYHTTWITDRTLDYLTQHNGENAPFFAWTSYIKPHHPFDPPKPYDTMYDPASMNIPHPKTGWQEKPLLNANGDPRQAYFDARNITETQMKNVVSHYYGLISHIDDEIGRIVAQLKATDQYDNTLIIFASDHGDYLGQYGLFLKHPNIPYDALARVPLILSGKSISAPGRRSQSLVSLVDLFPTLLQLGKVTHNVRHQGCDWDSILHNKEADFPTDRAILIETETATRGVRYGRYKYLYNPDQHIEELYDVEADPNEETNLSNRKRDELHHLRRVMLDLMISCTWDRHTFNPSN